jgi:hypothetical protein
MARVAGYGGAVHVATQVIEDCEDAWNEQAGAGVTASLDTADFKVGSGSAKFVLTADTGVEIVASEVIVSLNIATYTDIYLWVKSSVAMDANDWQLLLDDSASCASPIVTSNLPALSAGTWKFVRLTPTLTSCTAIISVGLKQAVDKGALSFWIDDIRAGKAIAGIKSWTLDYSTAVYDSSGFDSAGAKVFIPGTTEWSGSFEGFKDGAPLAIGSVVGLELRESSTSTQQWRGSAIITSINPSVAIDGLVTYSYNFQGVHGLEIPTT